MANTFTAPFPQSPKTGHATATTAIALTGANSVASDDPANTVLLCTAGADGAVVTRISAVPRSTVTATNLFLFIRKTGDGATIRKIIDSELMPAYTLAATTAIPETQFGNYSEAYPLRLAAGDQLYVGMATSYAAGVVFKSEFTDY